MSDRGVSSILDSQVRLLYLIAEQYHKKMGDSVWKDAMTYIMERPTVRFSELCYSDLIRATAWYHALSAIPATDMSLGLSGYTGMLISAIDDVIRIESGDNEKEES